MDNVIIAAIVQGGALVLLAFVLWQISAKVDRAFTMTENIIIRLLNMLDDEKVTKFKNSSMDDDSINPSHGL